MRPEELSQPLWAGLRWTPHRREVRAAQQVHSRQPSPSRPDSLGSKKEAEHCELDAVIFSTQGQFPHAQEGELQAAKPKGVFGELAAALQEPQQDELLNRHESRTATFVAVRPEGGTHQTVTRSLPVAAFTAMLKANRLCAPEVPKKLEWTRASLSWMLPKRPRSWSCHWLTAL